jgi:hypothetical protein
MARLLDEIKYDLSFIRSHRLQPHWWKVSKVFLLVGSFVGYLYFCGAVKTVAFFAVFMLLCLGVHMMYRVKTHKFTRTWLDFVVVEENGQRAAKSIGRFYYAAIVINAVLALVASQVLA